MSNELHEKGFGITIASLPDREYLVSEICFNNNQWAEINHENEEMEIQFYPHPNKPYWEFNLDKALEALAEAKRKLIAMGPKR